MAIEQTQALVEASITDDSIRNKDSAQAFTRRSPLGVVKLLHILLHRIYRALQLHFDDYFENIDKYPVSRQAFSKARKHLNPEYIRKFADMTGEIAASDNTMTCYNGMRLIAIDGSDIALENTPELKKDFGCSGSKKNAATALCFTAFAPLNQVIYDCRIDRYEKDERDLAQSHIKRLVELGLKGSLLLFDRWYPLAEFIAFLYDQGFSFVMRVRTKWNTEVDSVKTQAWIPVTRSGKTYSVRVLKVT